MADRLRSARWRSAGATDDDLDTIEALLAFRDDADAWGELVDQTGVSTLREQLEALHDALGAPEGQDGHDPPDDDESPAEDVEAPEADQTEP